MPTYANVIQPEEVSLALEHLLIAPVGTAWTPGKIDVTSPPAGFITLGAVQDDSPQIQVTKQYYRVQTGIPSVLAYQAVTQLAGQFGLVLHTFHNYHAYVGLGGLPPYNLPNTTGRPYYSVSTATSRTLLTVSSTSGWNVNDMVVTDTTANLNTTRNYAWIDSIVSGTSVHFSGDGLKEPATNANPIVSVAHSRYALGTAITPQFRILGVADFLNNAQVVHDLQKALPSGQWTETLRNGQHAQVQAQFDLFGYTVSTPYSTASQLVVGERYLFLPNTIQ